MSAAKPSPKFRETLWFKKGEVDAVVAQAAAVAATQGVEVDLHRADSLPIEDRYRDDGSLTRDDSQRYSLRTGATEMMAAVVVSPVPSRRRFSERQVIREMTGTRIWLALVVFLLAAGIAATLVTTGAVAKAVSLFQGAAPSAEATGGGTR